MTGYFDFGRNEECPCGSGKKYKKCCQPRVEEVKRYWRNGRWRWVSPSFATALAVLCGTKEAFKEERVPTLKEIADGLDELSSKVFDEDDELEVERYLKSLLTRFATLLETDPYWRNFRFTLTDYLEILRMISEEGQPRDGEEDEEVVDRVITKYLKSIDDRQNEDFAWRVFQGLRMEECAPADRPLLLMALNTLVEKMPGSDNPFWEVVLRTSLAEAEEATEAIDAMENDDDLDAIAATYPIIRKHISSSFGELLEGAKRMLHSRRLILEVPGYAIIGGLMEFRRLIMADGAAGDEKVAAMAIERAWYSGEDAELEDALDYAAWEIDYDFFVEEAVSCLEHQLHEQEEKMTDYEKKSVEALMETFGEGFFDSTAQIYEMCYRTAFLSWLKDNAEHLGDPEWFQSYASGLEESGQTAAAEHVRKVISRSNDES